MPQALTRRTFGMLRAEPGMGRALALAIVCGAAVALPVFSVFASFWRGGASADTLQHLMATVIPSALLETSLLGLAVVVGVVAVGAATGWLVATCEFLGRRTFEWALLLPLAMPAYIVAYAYTDYLQYAGPLQTALRDSFQMAARRLLVSRDSIAGRCGVCVYRRPLPVRVLARTHRVPGAYGSDDGRGAQPRADGMADVVASQLAAGAPRDCRWCAAGVDGNARRLRRGVLLRPANVYDIDLSRLVFAR